MLAIVLQKRGIGVKKLAIARTLQAHLQHLIEQHLKVIVVIGEINMAGIHNQQRRVFVVVKKLRIGIRQRLQVIELHGLLEVDSSSMHPFEQGGRGRLQINHEIGLRRRDLQTFVNLQFSKTL